MLKRILIVAATLAAHSGAALADNNWAFDDPFWSRDRAMQSAERTSHDAGERAFQKYEQVDGYNS